MGGESLGWAGTGWRRAMGGEGGTSVIVSTTKIFKKHFPLLLGQFYHCALYMGGGEH